MNKALEEFQQYLQDTKKAQKNTVDSYTRDAAAFVTWLAGECVSLASADSTQVQAYLDMLGRQGRSQSSVRRAKASLRCFFGFLRQDMAAVENPVTPIKLEPGERRQPDFLTKGEVDRLLSSPDVSSPKGLRDRCMLDMLYATGLKVSELVALNVEDVSTAEGYVRCVGQKHTRVVPIHAQAARLLERYLARRPAESDERALFLNMRGGRMTRQGLWKLLKHYSEAAEIEKCITPQTLRYTLALHLFENGADRRSVQDILGYADLSSLQACIRVFKSDLHERYQRFHPKAVSR